MHRTYARIVGVFILFTLLCYWASPESCSGQARPQATRFEVKLDPKVAAGPLDGRLFIFLSERNRGAPRTAIDWFSPEPVFAVDVSGFAPGETHVVDEQAIGFPNRLPTLPHGKYHVHALLAHSDYDGDPGRAVGNLFSQSTYRELDPSQPAIIQLELNQVVAERPLNLPLWSESIEVPCPLLGEFHGREHLEPAMVVLPPSYSTHPERRFPVMYCIPSFDVTHLNTRHWQQLTGPREAVAGEIEFIRVVLNGQGPWGHHSYANSATNGPRADSLVREFVPFIDARYRTVAEPTARFLTGHSSGGWSSLWLQIQYPQTFGGVWSSAPDPVDFRSYQGVNIYANPPENVYVTKDGQRRPLSRSYRNAFLYWDSFTRMDDVYGRGGQLRAFEAVFSPLDEHGKPARLFDRQTGLVDPAVAEQWKAYDIRHVLQNSWKSLKPKLEGKIHLLVGSEDTFFLNEAVSYLCAAIPEFQEIAEVEILEGRNHLNMLTQQRSERLREQLSRTFLAHHRQAYGGDLAKDPAGPARLTFVQHRIQSSDGKTLDLQASENQRTQFGIPYSVRDSDLADIAQLDGLERLLMPRATQLTDEGIRSLQNLDRLVELDLNWTNLTDAAGPHLAAISTLEKLGLAGTQLRDDALVKIGKLPGLQDLNLRSTAITSKGVRFLASLPKLKILDLSATQVDGSALEALSDCPTLEVLHVQSTWITAANIQPLLSHPSLKQLDLSGTLISVTELAAMQEKLSVSSSGLRLVQTFCPFTVDSLLPGQPVVDARIPSYRSTVPFLDVHLSSLTRHTQLVNLDLRGTHISDAGIEGLISVVPWHATLRKLNLQDVKVSAATLRGLSELQQLADLNLRGVPLGSSTDMLAQLSQLERLDLQDCAVTDLGVTRLQGLSRLNYLSLNNCQQITDRCVPYLQNLRDLRYLSLRGTSVSPNGIQTLQKELPACSVHGDSRRWEYRWQDPHAAAAHEQPQPELPPLVSTARSGRVLIDSSRCDASWWMGQQPSQFDAARKFQAKSALDMLRQRGYEVELVKPGETVAVDTLASYDVVVRQRPWKDDTNVATASYHSAVEAGLMLILELSPGYIEDTLASSFGLTAGSTQRAKAIALYRDHPLAELLGDYYGPYCVVNSTNPNSTLAWLDKQRDQPVAGFEKKGEGAVFFVGTSLVDPDRLDPIVRAVDSLLNDRQRPPASAQVLEAPEPRGPKVVQLDYPSPEDTVPQPGAGYWQFRYTAEQGAQTSQVVIYGPTALSHVGRPRTVRDGNHTLTSQLSHTREIPRDQAGQWQWQARACSATGVWGPWSDPRVIRIAPTAAETAALLPPQPEAPKSVAGMHLLPVAGSRVQFLGDGSFLLLETNLGAYQILHLGTGEPTLVTDKLRRISLGASPFIFGDNKWLVHLQPQADGQSGEALMRSRDAKMQPLLMRLDENGQVLHEWQFQHSDNVTARYLALGRWFVTRSREDNRLWDLTVDDPTAKYITIDAPQNQHRMDPFSISGRWMLAGDQLIDLDSDDPRQTARQLPADTATRAYFSSDARWLVRGRSLVDLQQPDWSAAIQLLPDVPDASMVRFSPENRWLLNGPWLIDLNASDPSGSAVRLGIDDRTNTINFSPDARWLFATSPARIQVWNLQSQEVANSMRETDGPGGGGYGFAPANAASVAYSPNHRWATVTSYSGKTLLFDLLAKQLQPYVILEPQNSYMNLIWTRNSRWLITGDEDGLQITDVAAEDPSAAEATRSLIHVTSQAIRVIGPVRLSLDRRWLCFTRMRRFNSANPAIQLWDLEAEDPCKSGVELPVPLGFNGTFSRDGRFLAIPSLHEPGKGGDYQSPDDLVLFDLHAKDPVTSLRRLPIHESSIRVIEFSPDGRWLVTSDMRQTRLFDLQQLLQE